MFILDIRIKLIIFLAIKHKYYKFLNLIHFYEFKKVLLFSISIIKNLKKFITYKPFYLILKRMFILYFK